ncbi:hypothetical protein [Aureivirga sp. CE67]|uniref:hypothetical protein n=1 Tax=Aureivirga sp. CE67 TaxID=1788983 RepID=UPI0018CABD55|nr:hypothetical protein [Aureivirga sp. CE67]
MFNSFVLILLFILSFLFLFVIQKKGKKSEVISFISTIIATLIGVWLAITLTNSENDKKEKEDTIKLLQSSINIIDETKDYTEGLNNYFLEIQKDTTLSKKEIELKKSKNPIPYPYFFETIVSNELFTKNVSEKTHKTVYNLLINMKKISSYNRIEQYKSLLIDLEEIIKLEVLYQKEEIDFEELEQKIDKITQSNLL